MPNLDRELAREKLARERRALPATWRATCALVCALAALSGVPVASAATPPPPPPRGAPQSPHPPPPPGAPPPPPSVYVPAPAPPVVVGPPAPPPLPIAVRIIYAPFYATGLVLRYGLYYGIVMPFEVLGRTLAYGVEGGVDGDPNQQQQ